MSMFRTPTSQRSFSELPLENVGNIMSYLPSKERARVATVTGSFLPVSEGYFGRGYVHPADLTRSPTDSEVLSASRTEMHRQYMHDRMMEQEFTLIPKNQNFEAIYEPEKFKKNFQKKYGTTRTQTDINYSMIFPTVVSYGLIETLKTLISKGVVNLKRDGIYLLHSIIFKYKNAIDNNRFIQCLEILVFLLKNGVNPNMTPYDLPPLTEIIFEKFHDDFHLQMNSDITFDQPPEDRYAQQAIEIVKTLLKYGANPTLKTPMGRRHLQTIEEEVGNEDIIEGIYVHYRNEPKSALDIVEYLLTGDAFPELPNRVPLFYRFIMECKALFKQWIQNRTLSRLNWVGSEYQPYALSKRKTSRRKTPKRKTPKRKTSKRKTSKRKTPKRKTSKRKTSRATKRR